MSFSNNLSKINKLVFLFGISPITFNHKANKFECSVYGLTYTLVYFLSTSITIIYIAYDHHLKNGIGKMLETTFSIFIILQFITVMVIFYSAMINSIVNRQMHANFLNSLVEVDSNLAKLNININHGDLSSLHKQHIFIVLLYVTFCIIESITQKNWTLLVQHLMNVVQFLLTISLTLIGYYIRCLAIILYHRCNGILESIDVIRNDLLHTNCRQELLDELKKCFKAFDELMNLKKQMSKLFGVSLLLSSAFDFIILTIAVYGTLYFFKQFPIRNIYYFAIYYLPLIIKCVLLAEALHTLGDQVGLKK